MLLREHMKQAAEIYLQEERDKLRWLAEVFADTKEQLQELIQAAIDKEDTEALSMLSDVCHNRFPEKRKKFSL